MVTKIVARAREVIVLAPKRTLIVVAVLVGVVILYVLGSEKQQQNGGTNNANAPATTACRVAVTADVLNVRAAPDAKSQIVGKFRLNAEADAEKTVQNGFRKLSEGRWVSNDYIKPLQGRDC
ncbi:SH3 domain-containing protein [Kibdelosporangium aridum]|uniref:SH3 domain-containing protein n=1 Tax=Kibdelosporangium aridum TaxID=2030 RepID=UPI0035ED26F7